ncbi:MAG: hypothetical protein ABJE95_39785 [Byssovorax sp.]
MLETFWTPAAQGALLAMPWRDAARVDAAVQRFAATGEGQLSRVFANDPRALRLRVAPYAVRLLLEPETGSLIVGWIFRDL